MESQVVGFLRDFSVTAETELKETDPVPFRLTGFLSHLDDLKGECFEYTSQYLRSINCPQELFTPVLLRVWKHLNQSINKDDYTKIIEYISEPQDTKTCSLQVLNSAKLVRKVINETHACLRQLHDEVLGNQSNGISELIRPASSKHCYSVHAIKNVRRTMEDRHRILPDASRLFDLQNSEEISYYAVFDGHCGSEAAIYANNQLHCTLLESEFLKTDPAAALKDAFLVIDNKFCQLAQAQNLSSGSTGVSVLIKGQQLHVGWLGDSQVWLIRDGQPVQLMNPHKPEREDEKQRIDALGGCVVWFGQWRVNGTLSVSRSIGDLRHKPFISGSADVFSLDLDGTEDYLILACDGLWDMVTANDLVHIVYEHCVNSGQNWRDTAQKLVQVARDEGSTDNISVLVVFLRLPTKDDKIVLGSPKTAILNFSLFPEYDADLNSSAAPGDASRKSSMGTETVGSGDQRLEVSLHGCPLGVRAESEPQPPLMLPQLAERIGGVQSADVASQQSTELHAAFIPQLAQMHLAEAVDPASSHSCPP